jgi:hypothetical protein
VPQLFQAFLERLKNSHPHCKKLKLCTPPIGGIVKTYGAAGPNYFTRGLLIGDAGSFVDPMTGEGITPAMESALIAARVLMRALDAASFETNILSTFEDQYRRYFDPAMIFTDLCAATLRNHHYWGSWKNALVRGCELAQDDKAFAAKVGACFGGLEVYPFGILAEVLRKTAETLFAIGPMLASDLFNGNLRNTPSVLRGGMDWMMDSWRSLLADPLWHASWALDVHAKWLHALAVMGRGQSDPRIEGIS